MNKENLLKAIELAEDPGKCQYFNEGKPSCVVGQLFALEGAKEEEFHSGRNTTCISNLLVQSDNIAKYMDNYPTSLLDDLQFMWDNDLDPEEDLDERRARMVELVNNYEG